jgi:hypothetical protein
MDFEKVFNELCKTGRVEDMGEFLSSNPGYVRTYMYLVINSTDNTAMAEEILKYYLPQYHFQEVAERFLDEPDHHIDFNMKKLTPAMQEWIKLHADIFLRPFMIIRLSRNHEYIIRKDKFNF